MRDQWVFNVWALLIQRQPSVSPKTDSEAVILAMFKAVGLDNESDHLFGAGPSALSVRAGLIRFTPVFGSQNEDTPELQLCRDSSPTRC